MQFHFWEYRNRNQTFILDSYRPFICSVHYVPADNPHHCTILLPFPNSDWYFFTPEIPVNFSLLLFLRNDHSVHIEWQWPISGVHSIMMEKSALAGESGGCTSPLPLYLLYHLVQKVAVYALAESWQIHSLYFISTLYVLCGKAGQS
jgi:hypothetical protein